MLVLSRKNGEEILIGDDICITIVDVRNNRVRLGFVAPKEIPILRAELQDGFTWVAKEKTQAASCAALDIETGVLSCR